MNHEIELLCKLERKLNRTLILNLLLLVLWIGTMVYRLAMAGCLK